jgi:hypothetical protein
MEMEMEMEIYKIRWTKYIHIVQYSTVQYSTKTKNNIAVEDDWLTLRRRRR